MIDSGYFAKRIHRRPEGFPAPAVREICSVSECISAGPKGWIEHWLHNELGWYNRAADALRVIPPGEEELYRLFAYRLYPELFRGGQRVPIVLPEDVRPEPISAAFRPQGLDSVSKSMEGLLGLECSPLSCNLLAAEFEVNECCLFPTLAAALEGAERFSIEQPEPGDYYVVEVLEHKPGID